MDYAVGQKFQLKTIVGDNPDYPRSGISPAEGWPSEAQLVNAPIDAGLVGTVLAVVPAAESGAGTYDEDHVVLAFDDPDRGRRHVSFTFSQMDELFASEG